MDVQQLYNLHISDFLKECIYTGIHNHSEYSNLRLLDCTNITESLVDTAIMLGHRGLGISDHECVSSHIRLLQYVKELHKQKKEYIKMVNDGLTEEEIKSKIGRRYELIKKMPEDFKLILGNEIYLVDSMEECRDNYKSGETKFYHFILQALDEVGHRQLRELSSHAWGNSFKTGMMERVPTTKQKLKEVVGSNKGHIIGSTACLGGFLGQSVLELLQIKNRPHTEAELFSCKIKIHNFIQYCIDVFGKENFYIEIQPSYMKEQIEFNKIALDIAKGYNLKWIIATDTHYLRQEDRIIHKCYLNSKEGEREVDDFYGSTYMMSTSELYEYWLAFGGGVNDFKMSILNTLDIWNKVDTYDLYQPETIPQRDLPNFNIRHIFQKYYDKFKYIGKCANSEYAQDRFFIHLIEEGFINKKQEFNEINIGRINKELKELWLISERLGQRMTSYYNLTELLIRIMWDDNGGNSIVGVARGSVTGFYTAYLMDITQINPIEWSLPHWRHISSTRPELPDIDIDTETIKREQIFNAISKYFGEDKVLNIATFKTEGTKSAILTSARGLGIDNDISQAVANLIPFERGKHWSLSDCIYGNEEKERKPVKEFINEINKYDKWLETAMKLEGLICGRSIHASGVVIFNDGYISQNSLMKAPNGKNITAFSMNDGIYLGNVKLDFLTVESVTKLHTCLDLLIEDKKIEWQGSLRDTYNKYIHPDVLDYESKEMWHMVSTGELMDLFQFSTPIGITTAKLMKPLNLSELAHANSLMRLMGDGTITPTEKYLKFKDNPNLWYKEMEEYNLTEDEISQLEKYLKIYFGVSATQEDIMELSMDNNLVGFDLAQANKLRKAVAKKSEEVMKAVKELFYKVGLANSNSINVLNYIWDKHIVPQLGYSFSRNHTLPYSAIALQEINLAYKYGTIYWNTAVLISNSGADSLDLESEDNKTKTVEYGKIAKAIGEMQSNGVDVALPNINKSGLTFKADEENNRIVYGLKGITGVGDEVIKTIIANRPYASFDEFIERVGDEIGNTAIISLIKAGTFDSLIDRLQAMEKFILTISKPVSKIGAVQLLKMIDNGLIPNEYKLQCRFVKFRKYIFDKKFFIFNDTNAKTKKWYELNEISTTFFNEYFISDMEEDKDYRYNDYGNLIILDKNFDKYYNKKIEALKAYAKTSEALENYNKIGFYEIWNKYCLGNLSKWEMDSLNFYYNKHELCEVDRKKYSIVNFNECSKAPVVDEVVDRGRFKFTRYKLHRICGTILDKDKNKNTLQLLTPDGVVAVKLHKGAFNHYDKQLSVVDETTGAKTVIEKSWFARGNKILVVGFRREDQFIVKKYSNSVYQHSVELITDVVNDGKNLITKVERTEL